MDKSQRNESRYSTLSRFQSDGLADVAVPVILACMSQRCLNFLVILVLFLLPASAQHSSYQYFRIGQKSEAQTNPTAGYALMGGGKILTPRSAGYVRGQTAATSSFSGRPTTIPITLT